MNQTPACPNCGRTDGCLGTSNAYYICRNPDCYPERRAGRLSLEVYFLGDGRHPVDQGMAWRDAVLASPFGREGSGAQYFEDAERLYRCEAGHETTTRIKYVACPEILSGGKASDALVMPVICGKPVDEIVECLSCGKPSRGKWYCDDCWSDKQGGYTDG